jgi:putative nucleotidyltransferase with HDIG domain
MPTHLALQQTNEPLTPELGEELWFRDDDPERSIAEASRSLAAALGIATGLRPFPEVLRRALALLADPEGRDETIVRFIEQDPALTSRLLRLANSALYAPIRPCETVRQAVMRLGRRNLRDMVAGVAVLGMFADVGGLGARMRDHSASVAAIARILAERCKPSSSDHVFLSALMHDVGKLLMMQAGEPRYELLDPELLRTPDRVHLEERRQTGYDHAILGAHVLVHWQLPDDVARAVAWHHQPGRAFAYGGEVGLCVALVRLADRIEAQAAEDPNPIRAFFQALARDPAARYANISAEALEGMWEISNRACRETIAAVSGYTGDRSNGT